MLYVVLLYIFALNIFPSWKRWVELKLLRPDHRRKESTRAERQKRKHVWSRLSQRYMVRFANCIYDFGTQLWRHKNSKATKHTWYIDMYYSTLYIVENAGRHDIDFGREGLMTWVSSVIKSLMFLLVNMSSCSGRRNKCELRLTKYCTRHIARSFG